MYSMIRDNMASVDAMSYTLAMIDDEHHLPRTPFIRKESTKPIQTLHLTEPSKASRHPTLSVQCAQRERTPATL
jgi:hypothetical protein